MFDKIIRMKVYEYKGFTLIEIILVIIVLSIIAIVAIPKFTDMVEHRRFVAAEKIQADLRWAQQFAVNKNCRARVVFNSGAESYAITENSSGSFVNATDPTTRGDFNVQLNTGHYSGVVIDSVSFDGQDIVEFDSIGRPYSYNGSSSTALSSTGRVYLTGSMSIDVTPETGKIEITK